MAETDPGVVADELLDSDELLDAIAALRRQLRRFAGRPWPVEDLNTAQIELLRVVRRRPAVSVAEAAEELGVAANTVSTLVGQLTALDLLSRATDGADRRVARLSLTAQAQQRAESWRDRRAGVVSEAVQRLDESDRTALADAVGAVRRLTEEVRIVEASS
ncbi:MAG TPA: MarR family transcriptional regulator [Mycobacteriales bacterium]|nr:MarR family transcriptional regulator [Mycobacteriales bacterium]